MSEETGTEGEANVETDAEPGRIGTGRATVPLRYLLGLVCVVVLALLPLGNVVSVASVTVLGLATCRFPSDR